MSSDKINEASADEYCYIKIITDDVDAAYAHEIVEAGSVAVVTNGDITEEAKEILDKADIAYFANVDPEDIKAKLTLIQGGKT